MLSRLKNQMQSVVILLLLLIAIPALAETIEMNGYLYDIHKEEKVATLMRYTGTSTSVEIPTSKYNDIEYLSSVTFGKSVTTIGYKAFSHCYKLKSVTCLANKVPATNPEAFDDTPQRDVRRAVSEDAIDDYKKDETWSKFEQEK